MRFAVDLELLYEGQQAVCLRGKLAAGGGFGRFGALYPAARQRPPRSLTCDEQNRAVPNAQYGSPVFHTLSVSWFLRFKVFAAGAKSGVK